MPAKNYQKNYFGWCSLMKFVWYIFTTLNRSILWVGKGTLSNDFSTQMTLKGCQYPCDITPLK